MTSIRLDDDVLVVGTLGRGVWQLKTAKPRSRWRATCTATHLSDETSRSPNPITVTRLSGDCHQNEKDEFTISPTRRAAAPPHHQRRDHG